MTGKERTLYRKTSTWANWRKYLIEKRNNTCEICGMVHNTGLNVHHHDPENYTKLVESRFSVLCRKCHMDLLERLLKRKTLDIDVFCENLKRIYRESKIT